MKGTPMLSRARYSGAVLFWTGRAATGRSATGRVGVATAALICVAAAAGCSSSSTPTTPVTAIPTTPGASSTGTPAATSPGNTPTVAASAACPASSLQVKLGLHEGYAGGIYQVIDFTNTSSASCTLSGYPGVSLVTGQPYAQIGSAAKRTTTTPVKLITLAPGATATAQLQIVDALNFPSATCSPTKATDLKVYPPNQTVPVYLADTSYGCAKPVQTMVIGPVQTGSAHPMASPNGEGQ
jgi:hypothetical protein